MVRAILVGVALSACVAGSTLAQGRPVGPEMAPGQAYVDIQTLKAQIAALQQQMAQQKASYDNQLTDARFRITALESSQKQGGTATQLQASINTLAFRVTALEGYQKQDGQGLASLNNQVNATTNQLTALSTKFQTHTHTYKMTSFGFSNHELLPPVHIGEDGLPRPTSPPN